MKTTACLPNALNDLLNTAPTRNVFCMSIEIAISRPELISHALTQWTNGGIGTPGELLLSEVAETSIFPQEGLPTPQWSPLNCVPSHRSGSPRSGYRGSDLVQWHDPDDLADAAKLVRNLGVT